MSSTTLYRKYRPKNFEDVVGQEHITKTLANQILAGKISHAYLFTGSRGVGKTSVAKIFAKAVNCVGSTTGSPCGQCEVCKKLERDDDINVVEIDAASNNKVDDIREIREKVKFAPIGSKYKVYIIDEVHMLSESAFNALLKTLEEPPEYVIFILATTEVHKLPATILSRCVRFDFRLVSVSDLEKHLARVFEKEGIECDADALKVIATAGEGSVRDTLSIVDCINAYCNGNITKEDALRILGTTDYDLLITYFDKLSDKDIGGILELINDIETLGKNLPVFAKDISRHSRDLLVCKTCEKANSILNLPKDIFERMNEQAGKFTEKQLIGYMKLFSSAEAELRYTLSTKLLLETVSLSAVLEEDLVKKKLISSPTRKANEREIWGKVVLFLKEHREVALHVACGDITDVVVENGVLTITASDNTMLSLLESGKKEIERALSWQGQELAVEIKEKKKTISKTEEDLIKLKKMFGDKLKIKK